MRSRLAVVALMLVSVVAAACGKSSLVDEINVDIGNNLIFIPVQVNASSPLTFILDTGASGVVIDKRRVADAGLNAGAGTTANTGGGSVAAQEAGRATMHVGRAELADTPITAIDLSPLERGTGRRIDGILGYEFFSKFVVEIDYAGHTVRIHDAAAYVTPDGMAAVPVTLEEQLPIARIELLRASGSPARAAVEIDTGMTGSLTLTRPFVDQNRIVQATEPRLKISTGALLPGQVSAEVMRVRGIRLGAVELPQIVARVTPTAEEAGVSGQTVGLVGGDLLRRFSVIVDYPRSRILLNANGLMLEPDEFDMAGMSLIASQPQVYGVRQVIDGSPAAEAGVKAGDIIAAIDGKGTAQTTLDAVRNYFQEPGKTYVLLLKRGTGTLEVRLTTRRLI